MSSGTGPVEINTDSLKDGLYKLDSAIAATPATMRRVLTSIGVEVNNEIKRFARSGGAFSSRSKGVLASRSHYQVSGSDIVAWTTGVKYGAIQEFGGTVQIPEIHAKRSPFRTEFSWRRGKMVGIRERGRTGGVLAFMVGGQMVFARSARAHSVRIPGTRYAQTSFERKREAVLEKAAGIIYAAAGEKK